MEEKREIYQKKIYDADGKLKYVVIPNYIKTKSFMSQSELRFYKLLILVVTEYRTRWRRT